MNVSQKRDEHLVHRLTRIVEEHLCDEGFGVSELAQTYGYSRSHLHRKVKGCTGKSLSQFIRDIRLEKAHALLLEERKTVSEVAYAVGFNSPTYFSTCFKEKYGYPPGEAEFHDPHERGEGTAMDQGYRKWIQRIAIALLLGLLIYLLYRPKLANSTGVPSAALKIVVLPFKNWSNDPEIEYIGAGFTDEIITQLTSMPEIHRVIPYTTVATLNIQDKNTSELAQLFQVQYILEGGVQLVDNQIKITTRLIHTENDQYAWADNFSADLNSEELFNLQALVAGKVAEHLQLSQDETPQRTAAIEDPEIAKLFMQARYQTSKFTREAHRHARTFLQQIVAKDPEHVRALVDLGYNYFVGGLRWGFIPHEIARDSGWYYLNRARALPDISPEEDKLIREYISYYRFYYDWDFETMERENWPTSIGANYLAVTGRYNKVLELLERGLSYDPNSPELHAYKGRTLQLSGKPEEAEEWIRRCGSLFDDHPTFLLEAATVLYYTGAIGEAREKLDAFQKKVGEQPPVIEWLLGVVEESPTPEDRAAKIDRLVSNYEESGRGSPAWFLALYYLHLDQPELAMDWLDRAYARKEPMMIWIATEPALSALQTHPRIQALRQATGVPVVSPQQARMLAFCNIF